MTPAVVVSDLSIRYGSATAVDSVSFEVAPGEFFALLGPSGCGKTTLLRSIGGFVAPTSGRVVIAGTEMTAAPPYARPVNMVFQNYALFPHLSVLENIAYGLRRKGTARAEARSRATAALETVGLSTMAERFPASLSGGQQQRVALARAIVNRPKLLLLDEPLAALDLKLRRQMQLELRQLQQDLGIAFIMVTHDQEEAMFLADRIAVMDKGRLTQVASGRDLYDHPANRFVADFIGDTNLIRCEHRGGREWEISGDGARFTAEVGNSGTAYLNVRPEKLAIVPPDSVTDGVRLRARIDGIAFMGGSLRVFALSAGGNRLLVTEPPHVARSVGDAIDVLVDTRQATVLA